MYTKGECNCKVETVEYSDFIEYCPLHKAAPDLYEACKEAYSSLPVTATLSEFIAGHGNWGLNEEEYKTAKILAKALAKADGK